MNINWDRLIAQEQEWEEEQQERLYAWDQDPSDQDPYDLMQSEEEREFSESDDLGGFDEPPILEMGYQQMEHVGYGDPEFGGTIGGKLGRLEQIMQAQTVSKEKLYIQKLRQSLTDYFSQDKSSNYIAQIEKIPRFWLKNSDALAAVAYMIDNLSNDKLTVDSLKYFSGQTGIREEDLFRYYRLMKNYVN